MRCQVSNLPYSFLPTLYVLVFTRYLPSSSPVPPSLIVCHDLSEMIVTG